MTARVGSCDISAVTAQYLCNTCGACAVSCAQNAMQFNETPAGYLIPEIDRSVCTSCGLCYKVCPGAGFGTTLCEQLPQDPFVGDILSCEVGRATDESLFVNSQSGGVASAFLKSLFDRGEIEAAIVAIMRAGSPPRGDALIVRNSSELVQAQKSKYTPIPLLSAMREAQSSKGAIALVGLACHMHGLRNLQDIFPALAKLEIFRIGLVCDRIMLSTAIDFIAKKATSEPVGNFTFRDKQFHHYPGNPVIYKAGGDKIVLDASLRMAIKDFFTPARCRLCFDKMNVYADIVCGDPHGIEGVDRQNGETLVLGRTQAGKNIIERAKNSGAVNLRAVPPESAVRGQNIQKKRQSWAAYMSAWHAMGRSLPRYPFDYSTNPHPGEQKLWLNHALRIDGYASTDDLMKIADRWLVKQKNHKFVGFLLRGLRAVVRKTKKLRAK